jgi:16S rRNA (cytosine967-C5)-methyltransferase
LRLVQNVQRVQAGAVVTLVADLSKPAPFSCLFDDVLVDAPCSGTGTLRRHPEIRWRLSPDDLHVTTDRQRRILGAAADLVRPGGRLVYSVCFLSQKRKIIEGFLAGARVQNAIAAGTPGGGWSAPISRSHEPHRLRMDGFTPPP